MNYVKNIFAYLGAAFIITLVSSQLQSSFLSKFLYDNIITLLITLLAINTATSSLIISKLQEIAKELKRDFNLTYRELKNSLIEQIILIGAATVLLILKDSKWLLNNFSHHNLIFDSLLTAVFIYAMDILRDTGKAIFDIIKFKENNS